MSELSQIDFSDILSLDCPNDAYTTFIDLYKKPFDTAFPLKTAMAKSRNIKREPWMTVGLLNSAKIQTICKKAEETYRVKYIAI